MQKIIASAPQSPSINETRSLNRLQDQIPAMPSHRDQPVEKIDETYTQETENEHVQVVELKSSGENTLLVAQTNLSSEFVDQNVE